MLLATHIECLHMGDLKLNEDSIGGVGYAYAGEQVGFVSGLLIKMGLAKDVEGAEKGTIFVVVFLFLVAVAIFYFSVLKPAHEPTPISDPDIYFQTQ